MHEGAGGFVQAVEPTEVRPGPEDAACVSDHVQHGVGAQALQIPGIMLIPTKGLAGSVQAVEPAAVSADPEDVFVVFEKRKDGAMTEAVGEIRSR